MRTVITREYSAPAINRREILRYMGCKDSSRELESLIDRAISLCEVKLSYKVCYSEFPLEIIDRKCYLGFAEAESRDLAKCLSGCEKTLVFAATVGLEIDRLILRYGIIEPSLALCIQALGAERIEALCDTFCDEMKARFATEGKKMRPRFSAGYGDLPLSLQKEIFASLECEKRIGLTLNDSLLMSPTKSVTAIIGIY